MASDFAERLQTQLVRRRPLIKAGLSAAALAGAGGSLFPGPARAAGTVAHGKITLDWQPWRVGWGPGWDQIFYEATAPYRASHPGIDIKVDVSTGTGSNDTANIPAILSGTGPDVYSGYIPEPMIEGGYNLDIAPYLRDFNVDTSQFDGGQYSKYVKGGSVYGLPAELSTSAVAIDLTVLDTAGLAYPDKQWDYRAAERLWRAVAKPNHNPNKAVWGFQYWGQMANFLPAQYYFSGWGASIASYNWSPKCELGDPRALAFGNWFMPLVADNVITWIFGNGNWPQQIVCGFAGSWMLPQFASMRSLKWDFWPQPYWPTGTTAYAGNDYYAVPVSTKHPNEAAEFMIWLTTSTVWQRAMMRLQLVLPPTRQLWPEWASYVRTVAPPLADKNLDAFTVAAAQARAINHPAFAYFTSAAYNLIGNATTAIVNHKLSVEAGFAQAATAVDAFEAASASVVAANNRTAALLRQTAAATGPVSFQAPTRTGFGVAPSVPPKGYITQVGGQWTLVGDGSDVWGTSDNCTFAGLPLASSQGVFTCRVTAIANSDCPNLSQWAKVGLMARGDLSDDAPMVLICASGANGVFTDERVTTASSPGQQQYGSPPSQTGLVAPQFLTSNNMVKTANYLLKPVWLRLRRSGVAWTAYSSWDGKTWTAAGTSLSAQMAGCWVGIFCLSHNSDFNGKGTIKATFDNLSFHPTAEVQLGAPGQA